MRVRARAIEQLLQLGVAHHLEQRLADEVGAQEQHLAQRRVHERDLAVLVEEEHALLHAVEDAAHEVALAAELADGLREAPGELIERGARAGRRPARARRARAP